MKLSIARVVRALESLGARGALDWLVKERWYTRAAPGTPGPARVYRMHARGLREPMLARAGTSDRDVFSQVFVQRQYRVLDGVRDVQLIVDCGAYVGYSAAYFLARFPDAQLIAVEPDPGNAALLRRNVAAYGSRARVVEAAAWSGPAELALVQRPKLAHHMDGRDWVTRVRPVSEAGDGALPRVRATGLAELLAGDVSRRIGILKVDIEGAEAALFGAGDLSWLDRVDHLVIELHDSAGAQCVFAALRDQFEFVGRGPELTYVRRAAERTAMMLPAN